MPHPCGPIQTDARVLTRSFVTCVRSRISLNRDARQAGTQDLPGSQVERLNIGNRLGSEGLEDRSAGRETVSHPRFVAVLVQCRAPFSAANVDEQPGSRHSFELVHEFPRSVRKLILFELAEDAVVERHSRALPGSQLLLVIT